MIIIGNQQKIAFGIEVDTIEIEKGKVWGGFEIWINGNKFGDINDVDLITGNNCSIAEKLSTNPNPEYPLKNLIPGKDLLKKVMSQYFNYNPEVPVTLVERHANAKFWGQYILLPNNNMPFDRSELIYYGNQENTVFIYMVNSDDDMTYGEISINGVECKSVANDFIAWYNSVLKR